MFNRDESGGLKDLSSPVEFKLMSEEELAKEAPEDTLRESEEIQVHATVSLTIILFSCHYFVSQKHISAIATCARSRPTKR